jgi:hypothetical protein
MDFFSWEKGQIKIPEKDWPLLKEVVRNSYNEYMNENLNHAQLLYEKVCESGKGIRNFSFSESEENINKHNNVNLKYNKDGKPLKPKKANYSLALKTTTVFYFKNAEIGFDNDSRFTYWEVYKGVGNVERCRLHPIAISYFNFLDKIRWTSKTGGVVIGNSLINNEIKENIIILKYGGIGSRQKYI